MADHEANRGLKGLRKRIRFATSCMPSLGITPLAQVTKIARGIGDHDAIASHVHVKVGHRGSEILGDQRAWRNADGVAEARRFTVARATTVLSTIWQVVGSLVDPFLER